MTQIVPRSSNLTNTPHLDYILLDGSGSMQDKWWETLSALDTYFSTLRATNLNADVKLATFDSTDGLSYHVQVDAPLSQIRPFTESPIGANFGGTPLYDAIEYMGLELNRIDPQSCSILIVTDGHENGSLVATLERAKQILDWCRGKGWQVTFMGCDFNNSLQAKELGIDEQNAIGVQKKLLSEATKNFAKKRAAYGYTGSDINFSKEEQQQFGGYLAAPPTR